MSQSKEKSKDYSQKDLEKAFEDVTHKRMTMRSASTFYGVPRSTLIRRINNNNSLEARRGKKPLLSPDEEISIVNMILICSTRGFNLRAKDVRNLVKICLDKLGRQSRFQNNLPSKGWFIRFFKRHNKRIRMVKPKFMANASVNVTEQGIRFWFR